MDGIAPMRADIASQMTPDMMGDIEDTLRMTSKALGRYEAYNLISSKNDGIIATGAADQIAICALEDLHERASAVVTDAENIANEFHSKGYMELSNLHMQDMIPDLSSIRKEAVVIITSGWNIEDDAPAFGQGSAPEVEDPFSMIDVNATYEVDDNDVEDNDVDELNF